MNEPPEGTMWGSAKPSDWKLVRPLIGHAFEGDVPIESRSGNDRLGLRPMDESEMQLGPGDVGVSTRLGYGGMSLPQLLKAA